jgi:hypothetical protein
MVISINLLLAYGFYIKWSYAESTFKKPYIKKISDISGFKVWYVDGSYIRKYMEIEFTNFGHHYDFNFIPEKELWIDYENCPDETKFYIDHMLVTYELMSKGVDYDSALVKADSVEKSNRLSSGLGGSLLSIRNQKDGEKKIFSRLYKTRLTTYSKNVNVWVVNGEIVRDIYFIDFTEGGHDKVYSFIPDREVWIDDDIIPAERKYILLHELHERYLMSKGMEYDKAHEESSALELNCRRNPKMMEQKLLKEINRKY